MTKKEWLDLFGHNLYTKMCEHNMSQRELADITGLSKTAINNYINGRQTPSAFAIVNMSIALNCRMTDLVDFGEPIELS